MKQFIYAHRGASGFAPENTMEAFNLAIEKGVDGIEFDVHLTRDKQLIVFHDPILDRTTNATGFVKDFTLDELQKLDAGDGEKIPTLLEVVALAVKHNKKMIIEFKTDPVEDAVETAKQLAKFLHEQKLKDIIVYSYWIEAAKVFSQFAPFAILPGVVTYLGTTVENHLALVKEAQAKVLSVDWVFLTKELVKRAADEQITLCAYVLNDKTSFNYAKTTGAEILLTDYPGDFTL